MRALPFLENTMELHELIEAVKAAKDKGELEALVKRELSIDLDRRKSLEVLRQSVLAGLGSDARAAVEEAAPEAEELAQAPVEAEVPAEEQPKLTMPEIADELAEEVPAPHLRLLRNKKTGREFVWTPALAKLADLEEV